MKKPIFDYLSYRNYLKDWIQAHPGNGRGLKSGIAEAIHCQVSYVSRVLQGAAEFSLEQADALNAFVGHSRPESEFFLLLVQYERAGSVSLENHFKRQIDEILQKRLLLKERLQIKDSLSLEAQATYYSSWYYAAIHMLISIEKFQAKQVLAETLDISLAKVSEVLEFLTSLGLATLNKNGHYELGLGRIHLGSDSPLVSKHHCNWRLQAVRSLENPQEKNLHYSVLTGISDEDAVIIRELLVRSVSEIMEIVHASKQQGVHALNLDFFRL